MNKNLSSEEIDANMNQNLNFLLEKFTENPNDATLYGPLADLYFRMKDYAQASRYARMGITAGVQPGHHASISYRILLNVLKIQQADFRQQEQIIQQAMKDFPRLPDLYAEYALLFFKQGQCDNAEQLFKQALLLAEHYHEVEESTFDQEVTRTYLALGRIYEQKNDYKQAIEYYQKILEINKYDSMAFAPLYHLIYKEDPIYCIAYLNSLYDKNKQADLEFLIVHISNLQRGKILAYYMQAHNKLLTEQKVDILSMEATENYENVQVAVLEKLKMELPKMTGTAILLGDFRQVEPVLPYISSSYQNILLRFYRKTDRLFVAGDFLPYKEVLQYLIQADKPTVLMKYCLYAIDFAWRESFVIAQTLQEHGYFSASEELYRHILAREYIEDKKDIVYNLAYCYYKMQNYQSANQYFLQARSLGCKNKELDLFIVWSKQQVLSLVEGESVT